jgi:hypothetical protein
MQLKLIKEKGKKKVKMIKRLFIIFDSLLTTLFDKSVHPVLAEWCILRVLSGHFGWWPHIEGGCHTMEFPSMLVWHFSPG